MSVCFDCSKNLSVTRVFQDAVCFTCMCQRQDNAKDVSKLGLPSDLSLMLKDYIIFN